jgi:hypothetical protein
MEIKHLQSLTKRQGNSIAFMELYINSVRHQLRTFGYDAERVKALKDARSNLKKLVKLQHVLKKEMSEEIGYQRIANSMALLHEIYLESEN